MKIKKTATLEDLKAWRPCWLDDNNYSDRVKSLAGRRKYWSLTHVLALRGKPGLSDADWQWLVHAYLKNAGRHRALRLVACYYAGRALRAERKAGREPDARIWEAVRVAKRHAAGKATDGELDVAGDAAAAATAAAWALHSSAARAATGDAAAWATAGDASAAAAIAVTWAASRAAECKAQCDWLQRRVCAL